MRLDVYHLGSDIEFYLLYQSSLQHLGTKGGESRLVPYYDNHFDNWRQYIVLDAMLCAKNFILSDTTLRRTCVHLKCLSATNGYGRLSVNFNIFKQD